MANVSIPAATALLSPTRSQSGRLLPSDAHPANSPDWQAHGWTDHSNRLQSRGPRRGAARPRLARRTVAPAFRFLEQWLPKLTPDQRHQWQYGPGLSVYHYGLQQQTRLGHGFLTDLQQYSDTQLTRPVPTHILHGRWDEVIALSSSQQYASQRPWVTLETLETDHAMASAMESIWQRIVALCDLQPT